MTTKSDYASGSPEWNQRDTTGNTELDSNPLLVCGRIIDADGWQAEKNEIRPCQCADIIVAKEVEE